MLDFPELSAPKLPDDPESIPVFKELTKWHDDVMVSYNVDVTRMNDPFMPIETVARPPESDNTKPDLSRLPMIQRLALNQFTLSAIVEAPNPANNTALVDAGGKGYLIEKGTKIGPNDGVVREITSSKVIIEEPEVNYRGERSIRVTEMSLNVLESSVDFDGGEGFSGGQ
ncbi:MAG: pilus assembly protein PilP [Deltaproteobacteria bacterium]|jgi:Tfp pilus assembly protein PilP|nr:pilus assembly protein PilP [Deltaproteobacteria bacterium]